MPELPDIVTYVDGLKARIVGQRMERLQLRSSFVLRSVDPPIGVINGGTVRDVSRLGKRIVMRFDAGTGPDASAELCLVLHLMIAGRLRWREPGQSVGIGSAVLLATLGFPNGTLFFTEVGPTKRASMQLVRGSAAATPTRTRSSTPPGSLRSG